MSDPETPATPPRPEPQTMAEPAQPRMEILTQCVRDVSFENALAQKGLYSGEVTPAVEVQVALDVRKRPEGGNFEIIQKYKSGELKDDECHYNLKWMEKEVLK